jgi:hypothetical protein
LVLVSLVAALTLGLLAMAQRPEVGTLNVGDTAPNFKLRHIKGSDLFELKASFGKQPTVLVFGSYT